MLEISRLRGLFLSGQFSIDKIAQELGRTKKSVERKLNREGLKNPERKAVKYTDEFKKAVIEFYYATNISMTEETFGIDRKVIEGILRRARAHKQLPVVKIGERKNEWKLDDVLETLRYLGLKDELHIANKIGKTESAVSSYIKRRGFRLHYINGLQKDYFNQNFKLKNSIPFMRNLQGDVFIPWVTMEDKLNDIEADAIEIYTIKAMANFQRFLHGVKSNNDVIAQLWLKIEE